MKITQEELAFRSGLQPLFIARIEGGSNQPSMTALVMLARGLGTDPGELLSAVVAKAT